MIITGSLKNQGNRHAGSENLKSFGVHLDGAMVMMSQAKSMRLFIRPRRSGFLIVTREGADMAISIFYIW